ncbi:hypothetical protein MU480_14210, partial [Staphylococcus aureus]|nr:hypothetical protein [Staphylococcus aureus]
TKVVKRERHHSALPPFCARLMRDKRLESRSFFNAAPCCGIFIVGTYKILAVKPPKFGDLA